MVPKGAKPFIVSFEGIEGSGKTTQFNLFVELVKKTSLPFLALREPGSTPLGEEIRKILLHSRFNISPLGEALLFCASRVQMLQEKVSPLKKKVSLLVLDRFLDSTLAYQGSGKLDMEYEEFEEMVFKLSLGYAPHLTFVFDLDPRRALARKKDRDRFFKRNIDFHRRVRNSYLKLARRFPKRVVVLDSSLKEEEVFSQLKTIFLKRCPPVLRNSIKRSGII